MLHIALADISELTTYVTSLKAIMQLKEVHERERVTQFVPMFKELMTKELHNSYVPYNYMADLFIKLAIGSSSLCELIQENPEKFSFLRKWLDQNPYPKQGTVYWLCNSHKKVDVKKMVSPLGTILFKKRHR